MKQRASLVVAGMVVLLFFAGGVLAATADIDAKIAEQRKMIDKAVSSKSLTKDEAKILHENLKRIRERKQTASAGGKISEMEKGNIQNMLDRNSRMIADKKNNPIRPFDRPEIPHRFENQQKRIDNGIKSGLLTKQEAAKLQENLNKAKAKYAELTKDGKFTHAEETKMHELLDRDSQVIEKKKHN
jgi:polyhydroxyalkanoate synthesis regulator phasin